MKKTSLPEEVRSLAREMSDLGEGRCLMVSGRPVGGDAKLQTLCKRCNVVSTSYLTLDSTTGVAMIWGRKDRREAEDGGTYSEVDSTEPRKSRRDRARSQCEDESGGERGEHCVRSVVGREGVRRKRLGTRRG